MHNTSFISSEIHFFNVHPIAFKQQEIMIKKLKSLKNYVKTDIYHNWDKEKNTVSWHFTFDKSTDDKKWENTVLSVIEQYKQPS